MSKQLVNMALHLAAKKPDMLLEIWWKQSYGEIGLKFIRRGGQKKQKDSRGMLSLLDVWISIF